MATVLSGPGLAMDGSSRKLYAQAYEQIKRSIVASELAPGTRFSESSIARKLSMSKTPIREALQRLELEGLVVSVPQVGYLIPEVAYRDVREVFEVREALESQAAQLAATHMSDATIQRLVDRVAHLDAVLIGTEDDLETLKEFNEDLHGSVLAAADNRILSSMLESVQLRIMAALNHFLRDDFSRYQKSYLEHRDIVASLRTRNSSIVAASMQAHVRSVNEHILKKFR